MIKHLFFFCFITLVCLTSCEDKQLKAYEKKELELAKHIEQLKNTSDSLSREIQLKKVRLDSLIKGFDSVPQHLLERKLK